MSRQHGPSWSHLGDMILRISESHGIDRAGAEDIRQDQLLRNIELHVSQGHVPFPAYRLATKTVPYRVKKERARRAGVRTQEWDSWYIIDPEAALDIKRRILAAGTRALRPFRKGEDLTGQVFGDWRVDGFAGSVNGKRRWSLTCLRCGEHHIGAGNHLKRGMISHCTQDRRDRIRRIQASGTEAARSAVRRGPVLQTDAAKKKREYARATRRRREDAGLCTACGQRAPAAGIKICDDCGHRGGRPRHRRHPYEP